MVVTRGKGLEGWGWGGWGAEGTKYKVREDGLTVGGEPTVQCTDLALAGVGQRIEHGL